MGIAWDRAPDEELLEAARREPGAHRFRARKGPAAAWLFGIARNTLAIEALEGAALGLVEGLQAEQRQAVRARVVDERDYAEIAKAPRCSEAVVRKRVSRGLARLRDQLEEA